MLSSENFLLESALERWAEAVDLAFESKAPVFALGSPLASWEASSVTSLVTCLSSFFSVTVSFSVTGFSAPGAPERVAGELPIYLIIRVYK